MTLFLIAFAVLGRQAVPAGSPPPADAVVAFVAAWNQRNTVSMAKVVVDGHDSALLRSKLASQKRPSLGAQVYEVHDDGRGPAVVFIHLSFFFGASKQTVDDVIHVTKTARSWQIVPDAKSSISAAPVGLALLARDVIDPGDLDRAFAMARASECLYNERQVGYGLNLAAGDYGDTFEFKPNQAAAHSLAAPYIKTYRWTCLGEPNVKFFVNLAMAGKKSASLRDPARTVLVYEAVAGELSFPHDGMTGIVFADNHVELVSPKAAAKLVWKP